ncbi:hypothetical protein DICPUDRAFT_154532 [Dictyostelium purpureum]|uniref:Uncharacterized protein n=1 Tax=Dictyostelium purpureum TaxID=5786 RepID=F0ZRK8_DICPU|nr:uncharacterized protein DICPUDRAFT_154532 [Dictyostelium purpureum]EGC33424.1 hypothetical protein DICPUDRAFT_154532 [Dictyostelium purpureum]|eukprot:XP_003290043.1 hypothetical protein DICPUDRAFT_154532 [Dictyostelium purpureum]
MEKRKSIFFADDGDSNNSSSDLSSFTKRGTITPGKIANAREGELSQMIDVESEQKYQEIIELLVTGGYFRARIQGLSPFDKVVGGMAWSITASNVDVDADIFFQENSNIKQKVSLSEELIKALNRMKCPFPLQAQHITLLNYIALFPIIRWLIAKVIETREETGDLLRQYSEAMFSKDYIAPIDKEMKQSILQSCDFIDTVEKRYKPTRKFKRNTGTTKATPIQTLLEYGKLHRVSRLPSGTTEKSEAAQKLESTLSSQSSAEDSEKEEEKKIKQMMKGMKGVESDLSKVSGGVLKSFLPSEEITNLSERYGDMENSGFGDSKQLGEKLHRQKISNLEKLIAQKNQELESIKSDHEQRQKELEELQLLVQKKQAFNERIIRETEKLDQLETPENTKALQALRALVLLNETLVAQEEMFKASCKRQMAEYKAKIEALLQEDASANEDAEDSERQEQINQAFDADVMKLKKLKLLLNKKNRDLSLLQRFLDELPSRAELLQYQRQFVELSEQSSAKLVETRQYYTTYNTFEDKKTLLENELSILNSIQSKYSVAMSSANNKEMFIKSMDQIIAGIQEVLDKSESKWNIEKSRHDTLSDQYMSLLDQERNYYKLTKDFEEECRKNEVLIKKLNELQPSQ